MKKRSLLTSVAASTVLAGVLMLSGCGGSSTAADNINKVDSSKGIAEINFRLTEDLKIPVQGKDSAGATVKTAEIRISKDAPEVAAECTAADPCKVVCVQKSMCADELTQEEKNRANELRPLVPDSDGLMVLYAGDLTIEEASGKLTETGMAVTVKLPMCALAPTELANGSRKKGPRTCDTMKIYLTDADGSRWIEASAFSSSSTGCSVDHKDYFVTFNVNGMPTSISVFVLTDDFTVTGVSGGTGGEGYQ